MDPLVVLFGLGVGMLVGMTGIGGGSLMTPLLILVLGTKPVVAIGTDLAYGAITKTVGGWRHLRKGTVDLGVAGWLCLASAPGSLVGVVLVTRLHHSYGDSFDSPLLIAVAGALLVAGLATLVRALFLPRLVARERERVEMDTRARVLALVIGFVLGLVLGFTSVGSGALIGLALILVFRLTPHRVVGTDVFQAAILLWVAGLGHFASGNVDLGLMVNILVGSIPGVWIGTNLITRVPSGGLRPALGCVLLASSLAVASKAGIEMPAVAVIAVPVAIGLFAWWWLRHRPAAALVGDPAAEAAGADPAAPGHHPPAVVAATEPPVSATERA
ncbi:MAG: sulfite exporter TauE/SafE family protein [Solirubrobacteraceae bacterium]|jgi:uncharacterized protein